MRARVFIGSSSEALPIATALAEELAQHAECTVWNQGVVALGTTVLDGLVAHLRATDAAVLVLAADDITRIRDESYSATRDNVVFEAGLAIGTLGRDRTLLVTPTDVPDLRLPTDLLGIATARYDGARRDGNLRAALGPAATDIIDAMRRTGLPVD